MSAADLMFALPVLRRPRPIHTTILNRLTDPSYDVTLARDPDVWCDLAAVQDQLAGE
jgi:hypothetical protein